MINKEQKDLSSWAMDVALKNGCEAARVSLMTAINNSYQYRNLELEELSQNSENKLYIELYSKNRYASFSTNRLDKGELETFIKDGIISTQYLSEDKSQQLPDSGRYYDKSTNMDLEIYDPSSESVPTNEKLKVAEKSVQEIYGTNNKIISISSSYEDTLATEYMIASNGLEAQTQRSMFSLATEVSLKTDSHARIQAYWYDSSIFWKDLQKEGIAKEALILALRKEGQSKIKSGKYEMLLGNTVVGNLLSPMLAAISGAAIQQRNSFLLDKLGEKIASENFTLVNRPHIPRAIGARLYDGEGVATKEATIIGEGVLQTYFINTYYSHKLNTPPTLSAPSILCLEGEGKSQEEMIKSINKGIWVTGFNGGNSNPSSGDFSFGIEGFYVENGKIMQPVSEMNITGNLLEIWNSLQTIGNDVRTNSRLRLPSLLFSDVSFSGL